MTKEQFKKIAKKCPWYYHNGEPRCRAIEGINCSKNQCAMLYWVLNRPPNQEVAGLCSCAKVTIFHYIKDVCFCSKCNKPIPEQD